MVSAIKVVRMGKYKLERIREALVRLRKVKLRHREEMQEFKNKKAGESDQITQTIRAHFNRMRAVIDLMENEAIDNAMKENTSNPAKLDAEMRTTLITWKC